MTKIRSTANFPGPVLVVSNPESKNGEELGISLVRALRVMHENGRIGFEGPVAKITTLENERERIDHIANRLARLHTHAARRPITVFSVGGDRTASDVFTAVHRVEEQRPGVRINNWVWPGGRANDLSVISGAPAKFGRIPNFLETARRMPFWGAKLYLDGDTEPRELYHGATFGVTSIYFQEMADRQRKINEQDRHLPPKQRRKLEVRDYVAALPRAMTRGVGSGFFVSVDGGEPIPTGEIFVPVSHQFGRVGIMPLPTKGAAVFLAPSFERLGLVPIFEVLARGVAVNLGFQHAIHPGGCVFTLPAGRYTRHYPLFPEEGCTLELFDRRGGRKRLTSIINGDPLLQPVHTIRIETMKRPIGLLAAPRSQLMVRMGLAKPLLPGSALLNGAWRMISAFRGGC